MTLSLYFSRLILARFLLTLAALGALVGLLDLIDNANTVLDLNGDPYDLVIYIALRMIPILVGVVPLAVLIASIFVFSGLAAHQEVLAMRAAGITFFRIARSILPAAALIGIGYWALWNFGAPPSELALRNWLGAPATSGDDTKSETHWVRLGSDVLAFEGISENGNHLTHLTLYVRNPDGDFIRRLSAERAVYIGREGWRLEETTSATTDRPGKIGVSDIMIWQTPLRPADVLLAAIPPAQGALAQPRRTGPLGWIGANSRAYYATRSQAAIAILILPLVMICLTVPVATAVGRYGNLGARLGWGLTVGLAYVLIDGILRTLGESGALPAFVAAWGATILFLLAAMTILLYIQE